MPAPPTNLPPLEDEDRTSTSCPSDKEGDASEEGAKATTVHFGVFLGGEQAADRSRGG